MQSLRARLLVPEARPWPDRPVPITLVITDLDVGGAERALVALATRLDRARWAPSVLGLGREGALASPLREAGLDVACLDVDRRRPASAVWRLAAALRARRPALVQSFLFHANLASKLAGPLAGRPWTLGGLRVAERAERWHLTLDRRTQRLSAGSICVSEEVRSFSIRDAGLSPDRLLVIPNGIDAAPYDLAPPASRASLGLRDQDRILLFVGRIVTQKGLPVLLDAFKQLTPLRPGWHLVIVGEGPDRAALLEQTAADPGLNGRVWWLGRRRDVPSLMKAADLLVLPSLWEGMPNVVLEAMAASRPVVATEVEGIATLVLQEGDGATGWLARPGDPNSLRDALGLATGQTERRTLMGRNARKRVEACFPINGVVAAYEHVWAGVLGLSRDRLGEPPSATLGFGFKAEAPVGRSPGMERTAPGSLSEGDRP